MSDLSLIGDWLVMRLFFVSSAVGAMRAVRMQKMEKRAREQDKIGRKPQSVSPVLAKQEKRHDQRRRNGDDQPSIEMQFAGHILMLLSLKALAMTLTELAAIAAAAMIGDKSRPKTG